MSKTNKLQKTFNQFDNFKPATNGRLTIPRDKTLLPPPTRATV